MILGIMQPYFFPYIGYFSLIKHTDKYILSDIVQFSHDSWVARNRILKPNEGWQYIHVPLIKSCGTVSIKDKRINNSVDWKRTIFNQLDHYRKKAPNYNITIQLLDDIFSGEYEYIVQLNHASITKICCYLRFKAEIEIFSEMNLRIDKPLAADEWALNICKAHKGATGYLNPPGGQYFYNSAKYHEAGLNIQFLQNYLTPYDQKRTGFESGLSIIDILMFNSVEEINLMLDNYILIDN